MGGQVAISAHGPRAGTIEAYATALRTGAEYVEFDIRRTADGELTAFHDARTRQGETLAAISYVRLCQLAGHEVPRVAAVNRPLARAGVLTQCHRAGIKTMIWTVDEDAEMKRWLADPRVTVLITNRPADAVTLRAGLMPTARRGAWA
jgi:glycerophosphoryl diester phosphodiesterase